VLQCLKRGKGETWLPRKPLAALAAWLLVRGPLADGLCLPAAYALLAAAAADPASSAELGRTPRLFVGEKRRGIGRRPRSADMPCREV